MKRKIINIDETLCDGCGICVPSCAEQALQIVETDDGPKARLVKELFCDGLGACLGECPTGALTIEERDAEAYDENATVDRIKEVAPDKLEAHIDHMREHGMLKEEKPKAACGCPGAAMFHFDDKPKDPKPDADPTQDQPSELRQWPIQLHLVSPEAPYFKNASLSFIADCVPFAYSNSHRDFIKNKAIVIGCPKFDDQQAYVEKLAEIIRINDLKELNIVVMQVPCCRGLTYLVKDAMTRSGKTVPVNESVISLQGNLMS